MKTKKMKPKSTKETKKMSSYGKPKKMSMPPKKGTKKMSSPK